MVSARKTALVAATVALATMALGTAQLFADDAAAAPAAPAVKPAVYSGTFSDSNGRKGPMQCTMTPAEGGKWSLKFNCKNEGQGPNRPLECAFDLPGKKEADTLNLAGPADIGRPGKFDVTLAVTDKTVEGKFTKSDGKGNGTFSLKPGTANP